MDRSREEMVCMLRHCGLDDVADAAEADLPDQVDEEAEARFFAAHGLSCAVLMDRMGGSP